MKALRMETKGTLCAPTRIQSRDSDCHLLPSPATWGPSTQAHDQLHPRVPIEPVLSGEGGLGAWRRSTVILIHDRGQRCPWPDRHHVLAQPC